MKRFVGMYLPGLAVIGYLFWSDPDRGASTEMMLLGLCSAILAVAGAHYARKIVFGYVDLKTLFKAAEQGNIAAAIAALALVLAFVGLLFVFAPRAHAEELPPNAIKYLPMLQSEQTRAWPSHPAPSVLASLVEQETCISLKHARCWSPSAKLKTSREEGAGFGQITRAYTADGGLRFDTLDTVRTLDPTLVALSWQNIYSRPDLQLRALVLMNRDCYGRIARLVDNPIQRLAFCDAAYNGGWSGMQAERRACHLSGDCDPDQWFGNVDRYCLKSKTKWQGYGASACDINRTHVDNVMNKRRGKYVAYLPTPVAAPSLDAVRIVPARSSGFL